MAIGEGKDTSLLLSNLANVIGCTNFSHCRLLSFVRLYQNPLRESII